MALYRVQSNGKAPTGLQAGDEVVTGGGTYRILGVNADGSYRSALSNQQQTIYNYRGSYGVPAARAAQQPVQDLSGVSEAKAALGRVRRTYHGARVIDLDLLLYDGAAVQEKELTVPHPGMLERAFVLFPLSELFPERIACGLDFHNAPGFADGGSVLRLGPAKDLLS